jgi:hypothetical protein
MQVCRRMLVALAAVTLAGAGPQPHAQAQGRPDLQTVLDRASAYVLQFVGAFENVVAEETYVQETSSPRRKRTIKSDYLFVKYPDVAGSMSLRDPFEVDGKAVRDAASADRMMKLFTSPVPNAVMRARALAEEGARHNLLDIGTVNNPVLAMVLLQPNYRARFRFNLAGIEKDLGPTIRTVRFEEFRVPSILRMGANQDMLSRGLMWVDEDTGRVVKTRIQMGPFRNPPEVVTTYRHEPELGIDVPSEMRDWYPDGNSGEIRGVATYGRFRRFQVMTEETLK